MNNDDLKGADINHAQRLPFSQACENNKVAILAVLKKELQGYKQVLEVGSGTGQHSVYFAPNLPWLQWQTSDLSHNHWAIQAWHNAYPAPNLFAPLEFDLLADSMPKAVSDQAYDAIFTANTLHIIAWTLVERLFERVGTILASGGKFILYGPFNENGSYTSQSNQQFDLSLRQRDPKSGIRNKEDITALAKQHGLLLGNDYLMPANNQLLVFKKVKGKE